MDEKDDGHKHWMQRLRTDLNRDQVLQYFKKVALEENTKNNKIDFETIFDSPDGIKKALFVLNGDANSIFLSSALLESFSQTYPDTASLFCMSPSIPIPFKRQPPCIQNYSIWRFYAG